MDQPCGSVMTKNPKCCTAEDTVQSAAQLMEQENVGSIPVCEDQETKKIVGILTDRDLALKVVAEGRAATTRVGEVMTREVFACSEDDDIQKAVNLMERHQVRRVPILDDHRRIVGIIAQADVAIRVQGPEKTAGVVRRISKTGNRAA